MTEKKRLTVSFSHKIANQLEMLAKDQGLTKSGLLTVLISKEIERKESEQKK
ncbi:ribbon-helix-helix domain-containing protein [Lentilactobacillus kefiri]|uniref:ribbon-helix-helix domain-containing protein n=1 Tax=Lentilactobacillus kefiri TaxID=33962 RepID=UPI00345E9FFE